MDSTKKVKHCSTELTVAIMTEKNAALCLQEEQKGDPFINLPDITKYSEAERDELLRRLLSLQKQQHEERSPSPLLPPHDNASQVIANGTSVKPHNNHKNPNQKQTKQISNKSSHYYLGIHASKQITWWFMISLFSAFMFSSYNYICMTYQKNNYCQDPKLDDVWSWISYFATFMIITYLLGMLSYFTFTSYRSAKLALNRTSNVFVKGEDNDDFELYTKYKKLAKWMIGFYLLSLILIFVLYYFILVFATFINATPLQHDLFIFENPQTVVYLIRDSVGIFVVLFVYFPILSAVFSLFLYRRFCDLLHDISITVTDETDEHQTIELQHKLIHFRHTVCNLKLFLLSIPIFGEFIIVSLWNWQFALLMNLTFGHWNNGLYIWSILSSVVASCSLVLYSLSRKKMNDYLGDIFTVCINRKVCPVSAPILLRNVDDHLAINVNVESYRLMQVVEHSHSHKDSNDDDSSNEEDGLLMRLKTLYCFRNWPKVRKICTNLHSVITICVCIALIDLINKSGEYTGNAGFRWFLNAIISWTIMSSAGYLVSQLCSKDAHHRFTVLYKSWLMLIKIFLIRRCQYIVDHDRAQHPDSFIGIARILTVLTIFGLVIFLLLTTKFELIYFHNSRETKLILSKLFPGNLQLEFNICHVVVHYVRIPKWQILRFAFCCSVCLIFASVIWCLVFVNTYHEQVATLEYFYVFIWIVPHLSWHNEIVQYMRLHFEWNALCKKMEMIKLSIDAGNIRHNAEDRDVEKRKDKLDRQFVISYSSLQLMQPLMIMSCLVAFLYLLKFGGHLGNAPIVLCGLQLFLTAPLYIIAFWQS